MSAARLSVDRAGPALRLQLTLRLGNNRAAGAGLGFVRVFILRQGLRPCHPGRGDKADGDKRDAHGCSPLCLTTKPIYASHRLSRSALILINQPTSRCNPFRCVPAAALECLRAPRIMTILSLARLGAPGMGTQRPPPFERASCESRLSASELVAL